MTDKDICKLIESDPWMMDLLIEVKKLELPDWWIGAGFVRSKVWDHLHHYQTRTPLPDIDVIYFDKTETNTETEEKKLDEKLKKLRPDVNWSFKNQSRMHVLHKHKPYKNSTEALSYWVETATCVGVTLGKDDHVVLTAPRGIDDLVNLVLRPTPDNIKNPITFYERIEKKQWLKKWPKLHID